MRIVYLGAGAGGMYCGSCLHDNTLVAALIAAGEDAMLVPTYTPIRTDEVSVSQRRIFFGGINVYLQQKIPLFRFTPTFLDRPWDSPKLINWLARRASTTDAHSLGALTLSMLRGEHGHQRKELSKLIHWLSDEVRPDIVHLSNVLLMGMAHQIRDALNIPVVAGLSGEDIFLEKLPEPYRTQSRDEMRRRARDVAAYVAMNHYYANYMRDYLQLDPSVVHVVPAGLDLTGHATGPRTARKAGRVIGYLARICHDKGLHQLIDAFAILAADPTLSDVQLRVAGYLGPSDQPYFEAQQRRIAQLGLTDRFEYIGEPDRKQKINFLQSLDVMSLPTVYRESKGLSVIEAMANAVPVVLPEHGAFAELIEDTGGGLLCEPNSPSSLAHALKQLLTDSRQAEQLGRAGQAAVQARHGADVMAQKTLTLYQDLLAETRSSPSFQPGSPDA